MSCDVERFQKGNQKGCSQGQLKKLTGVIIALALCVAASGCKTVACLVITQSTDGVLEVKTKKANIQLSSKGAKLNKTPPSN